MGMMDKIKKMMSLPPEDEYEEEELEQEPSYFNNKKSTYTEEPVAQKKSYGYSSSDVSGSIYSERRNPSKVVSFNSSQIQVVLVKPTRFEDAPSIADHLNDKKTVVLNLEAANREVCRRLIDFLSGTAYATKGNIKKVANSTYIITPANVDVMGDLILDDIESGMFLG